MGAVDTTYTFTATDTITSTKMNNIIDQTTMTSDAIIGTTLEVASGKLKVRAAGITSNEMASNSVVTAAITDSNVTTAKIADSNVTTAKIADANVTQSKLAANVVGNGPAFRAWASTTTTIGKNSFTKVSLLSEDFDTNLNFSSSRFTPSVSGYYLITGAIATNTANALALIALIAKNGSIVSYGSGQVSVASVRSNVSDIIFLNGSTDYVELFAYQDSSGTIIINNEAAQTFMSGCLIRSA